MSRTLTVKNWAKFQHYRDRCPPWIKLHSDTFQNPDFARLPTASKLLAICIWTLASRSSDGTVPDDLEYIRQWGFLSPETVTQTNLDDLVNLGLLQRASKSLAKRKQSARPEERRGETETEGETEAEENLASSPKLSATASLPVVVLPLNDKTEYAITQQQLETWVPLYPAVDVRQQLNNMRGWCLANPAKCKTKNGITRFVNAWLAKEQNHGGNHGKGGQRPDRLLRKFQEISGQLETPGNES